MKLDLNNYWYLSDEHNASSHGAPLLVDKESGEAYGPGDIVKPDPSGKYVRAVRAVDRFLEVMKKELTEKEMAFVRKFFLQ